MRRIKRKERKLKREESGVRKRQSLEERKYNAVREIEENKENEK